MMMNIKLTLRNKILFALFSILALNGIATNLIFQHTIKSTLSAEIVNTAVLENLHRYFTIYGTIVTVAGLIIMLFIALYISETLTKPIGKLSEGLNDIAKGKWDTRIDISGDDEISQLANGFNFMAVHVDQSLQKIREAKQFTDDIIFSIPSMLLILDSDMNILSINNAFNKQRKSYPALSQDKFIESLSDEIQKNLDTNATINSEFTISPDKKTRLYYSATISKIGHKKNHPDNKARVLLTITDISERKEIEQNHTDLLSAVTKAKTEWEMTFDSVKEFILLIDKDHKITRCNKSFAKYTGEPVAGLIGQTCYNHFSCTPEEFSMFISTSDIATESVLKKELQTDKGRWLYLSYRQIHDINNNFIFSVVVATDITKLKNAQQQIKKSEAELKKRVNELEKFYNMAIGRELRMKDLKKEIKKLNAELSKYKEKSLIHAESDRRDSVLQKLG